MKNLNQPLQVYDSLAEQDRFKESCTGSYEIMSPKTTMIPFQILVAFGAAVIDFVKIRGTSPFDLNVVNNALKFSIETDGIDKSWFVYFGEQLVFTRFDGVTSPLVIPSGFYWFEVSIDGRIYYTDTFHVNDNDSLCDRPITMVLEAWHDVNKNGYYFGKDFKFRSFHNCFITEIDPQITDEFTKDGYERNDIQRRVIQYSYSIDLDPLPNSSSIGISALTTFKNMVVKHLGNVYSPIWINYKKEKIESGLNLINLAFTLPDDDLIRKYCDVLDAPVVHVPEIRKLSFEITEPSAKYVDVNLQTKEDGIVIIDEFASAAGNVNVTEGKSISVQVYSIDNPVLDPFEAAAIILKIFKNGTLFFNQAIDSVAGASILAPPFIVEAGADYSILAYAEIGSM